MRRAPAIALLLAAAFAPAAAAQKSLDSKDPLTATAAGPQEAVPAGGLAEVTVTLKIAAPWHLYAHDFEGTGTPIDLVLDPAPGLSLEAVRWPEPTVVKHDALLDEELRLLEGTTKIVASLRVDAARAPGPASAVLRLTSQACTDSKCLLADERELAVALQVRALAAGETVAGPAGKPSGQGPSGPAAAPDVPGGASLQDDFERALREGAVGRVLALCIVLAFVSLLTPCVFPMIPITVSFFAKRAEGTGTRGAGFALAYGGGIVATYTGFGVGMAALLGASSLQSVATNPWVNIAIGALFVFFGLSLLGFYDLRPPAFLVRRAESGVNVGRAGYAPVLLMGFVFTLTAFTCTAPIVGFLLGQLTLGGSVPLIVLGMFVYSLAFALPFVLLALFPGALQRLPGAGGWMVTVKVAMGFIELVAALKFLSAADLVWDLRLLSRPVMLGLATLLMAGLGLYLLGVLRMPHAPPMARRRLGRTIAALLALLAALYFGSGLSGKRLDSWTESFLPPAGYAGADEGHELIAWRDDLQSGKVAAREQGRPMFVDFTGVTCQNCRKVEKSIFLDEGFVEAVGGRSVPVRLYTDRQSAEFKAGDAANRALMEQIGSVTLPLYVLMNAEGEVLRTMGYDPSFKPQDFIDFLEVPRR